MKKLFSLDEILAAAVSGIGYGLGYSIPDRLGWHFVISGVVCMIAGGVLDSSIRKLFRRKSLQSNIAAKLAVSVFIVLFLCFLDWFSKTYLEIRLVPSYMEGIVWVLGFALFNLCISFFRKLIQRKRIRKKYGINPTGFVFSEEEIKFIDSLNVENKKIVGKYDESSAVRTTSGIFVGRKESGVLSFFGIPYAAPPVGDLRWKAPAELPFSTEVREAFYPGASPVQIKNEHNLMRFHRQSEDCLYLNIWKNALNRSGKKPCKVIVHIFGGDGSYGSSANPIVNGFNLVKANPDLIFINFNYRFGMLGFADFSYIPGGENYPDAKHLGLLDILALLNWVKKNIASFGGDPDNVTLAADTAGSAYALLLAVSERGKNLFRKVILLSTAVNIALDDDGSLAELTKKEADFLGAKTMDELLNLPAEKIAHTYETYAPYLSPVLDGKLLPVNVEDAFRRKKYGDVEFVFGITKSEVSAWAAAVSEELVGSFSTDLYDNLFAKKADDADRCIMKRFVDEQVAGGKTESQAKAIFAEYLYYRVHTMRLCNFLADNNSKVHCFLWNAKTPGDAFVSNVVSETATIMGNHEAAETFGFITDNKLSVVLQVLLNKIISDEKPEIFNNEIPKIPETVWHEYKSASPKILVVSADKFTETEDIGVGELMNLKI